MQTPASPAALPPDLEQLARRRASAKMGWFVHAGIYVAVNLGLALLALAKAEALAAHPYASWSMAWLVAKLFPLKWWGLAVVIHGAAVWLSLPGGSLQQRLLARERALLAPKDGA